MAEEQSGEPTLKEPFQPATDTSQIANRTLFDIIKERNVELNTKIPINQIVIALEKKKTRPDYCCQDAVRAIMKQSEADSSTGAANLITGFAVTYPAVCFLCWEANRLTLHRLLELVVRDLNSTEGLLQSCKVISLSYAIAQRMFSGFNLDLKVRNEKLIYSASGEITESVSAIGCAIISDLCKISEALSKPLRPIRTSGAGTTKMEERLSAFIAHQSKVKHLLCEPKFPKLEELQDIMRYPRSLMSDADTGWPLPRKLDIA